MQPIIWRTVALRPGRGDGPTRQPDGISHQRQIHQRLFHRGAAGEKEEEEEENRNDRSFDMSKVFIRIKDQRDGTCGLMCSDLGNDQEDLVSEDAANRVADGEGGLKKSRKKK